MVWAGMNCFGKGEKNASLNLLHLIYFSFLTSLLAKHRHSAPAFLALLCYGVCSTLSIFDFLHCRTKLSIYFFK